MLKPNTKKAFLLSYLILRHKNIQEFDIVVLQIDLPEHGLKAGDIGSIVHKYSEEKAVEVEFVTGEGHTLGVITLGYGKSPEAAAGPWAGGAPGQTESFPIGHHPYPPEAASQHPQPWPAGCNRLPCSGPRKYCWQSFSY